MAQILNGTYEILELAGKGGMSTVFKARHIRLHTLVAVKSVRKDQAVDLQAEVGILKKLDHPNLVRVLDVFEDEKLIYIVMDYIEGEDLQHIIKREKVIPEGQLTEWFITLADILSYLHSRKPPVIYRDMKPANIILQKDGVLKLVDFGIAREYKAAATGDTTYIGTSGFAAPEQFGLGQSDGRTDIYSLGMTMYYLATGKSPLEPPYTYVPARQLNPDLSEKMEKILERCIQFDPDKRYQSAAQLLEDLKGTAAAPVKTETAEKKRPAGLYAGIGIAAAAVLAGILFFGRSGSAQPPADASRTSVEAADETPEGSAAAAETPEDTGSDAGAVSGGAVITDTEAGPSGNTQAGDVQEHSIGLIISTENTSYMQYCETEILNQFREGQFGDHKYNVDIAVSGENMDDQLEQVDAFIRTGKELLIVDLADGTRADEVISRAAAADIPVIFFNTVPASEKDNYQYLNTQAYEKVCFIGKDPYAAGKCQGNIVAGLRDHGDINGDGKVSFLTIRSGPDDEDARMRAEGAAEALYEAGIEYERIDDLAGDWNRDSAQEVCAEALEKYGNRIEVIFCSRDMIALGAYDALCRAGVAAGQDMYLLGIDGLAECADLIAPGEITGTVYFDVSSVPDIVVQYVTAMVFGAPVPRYVYVDCKPIG
ncbi:MAG: substrate-binding domain-containing protein [Solobacterium sp.]|nr:substrate-binding domain-containing protein [Solobacterium sp.]